MKTNGKKHHRVAVLGAGILGCSTALFLARQGAEVVLIDRDAELLRGASRWNEGKIHLGFLYSGDPSLRTAKELLPGGLLFRPLMEDLLECSLDDITESQDLYLVHHDSIVSVEDTARYFNRLTDIISEHPLAENYLGDLKGVRTTRLSGSALDNLVDTAKIRAGFSTPERSVCTQWVADKLVAAVEAEPLIRLSIASEILGASRDQENDDGPFHITTSTGMEGPFTSVVNALWAGRPEIDDTMALKNVNNPSLRYRLSLFVESKEAISIPCAVICTGPFGDIKNYNRRKFYLSWYTSGLVYSSSDMKVPRLPDMAASEKTEIIDSTFENLALHIPGADEIRRKATGISVEGGWVFANGRGSLSDPAATLHKRDQVGIHQTGQWFSVDTGKYSIAPWLAKEVSTRILES